MTTKKIAILGAGFSGLTLAWHLRQRGFELEIFESSPRVGGLIQTEKKDLLVERAAHAFLASQSVENLCREIGLLMAQPGFRSKTKWLYRGQARRWTLSLVETLEFAASLLWAKIRQQLAPRPQESVAQWMSRNASESARDFLASPALQGIYGTKAEDLSATLILGSALDHKLRPAKGQWRGSVAPREGMEDFIRTLQEKLQERGVVFHLSSTENLQSLQSRFAAVVVATSCAGAAEILRDVVPALADKMAKLPRVSLSIAAVGFASMDRSLQGFGCLFPEKEKFNSLGVLFNSDLFENRGLLENESWIFKGDFAGCSDEDILAKVKADRRRLTGREATPSFFKVHRWSQVLPLYGRELESFLQSDVFVPPSSFAALPALRWLEQGARVKEISRPVYLTGNYLGAIGLTKILGYNERLAARIEKDLSESSLP